MAEEQSARLNLECRARPAEVCDRERWWMTIQHLRYSARLQMLRRSQRAGACTSDAIWTALTAGAVGAK
jgi:hypothetical protein